MKNNDVKAENRVNLLRLLYRKSRSRIELASKLGLSKSAVTGLITELESKNLVKETGRGQSSEVGGKKPIILSINPDAGVFCAIHWNDSACGIALADLRGELLQSETFEVEINDNPMLALDAIVHRAKDFLRRHRSLLQEHPLIACGVSVKGLVDSDKGILRYTSTSSHWRDVPIGITIQKAVNCPTFVDNDARSVMCLDMFSRPDDQMDVVGCIFIEDSVGVSVVIGNNVLKGAFFGATNFGHTMIDPNGPMCRCGKRGCWEALISQQALMLKARSLPGREKMEYEQLIKAYQAGDDDIRKLLLTEYCRWIGIGIDNYLRVFNPRRLVLYVDANLFDAEMTQTIERFARIYENPVTAPCELRFASNGMELHLNAAISLAIKNFLSPSVHESLMKGATEQ